MPAFNRDAFLESFHTGTAVPISALLSKRSQGIGDFSDLASFGEWCAKVGLDLIQILPVNDTGTMASPYSALSAFALHPIYLDLLAIEGAAAFSEQIEAYSNQARLRARVDYESCRSFKMEILQSLFESRREELGRDSGLAQWIESNEWMRIYASYLIIRKRLKLLPWYQWEVGLKTFSSSLVERTLSENEDQFLFHSWVQYELDRQFRSAKEKLEELGVFLKGDIPILMNDDSADVWANPDLFDMSKRAGAPPDMFVKTGQHWGFPTYKWAAMADQDFKWWIDRLKQAEKFYHLFRIDHVLGFFRIWSIPEKETTGTLGVYEPILHASMQELSDLGLTDEQIASLSRSRIERETSVDPNTLSEGHLSTASIEAYSKEEALEAYRDRSLIPVENDHFAFTWYFKDSSAFASLPKKVANGLVDLKEVLDQKSESMWDDQGRRLLSVLKDATSMLPCAEDLGVVPDCVPAVLRSLDILSLKIERWMPSSEKFEGPILHPKFYPYLSVCTTSVHDTDTLRGWWENEEKELLIDYYESLDLDTDFPEKLDPGTCRSILARNMDSNSMIIAIPIQDFLALESRYYSITAIDERVNVPGTVVDTNWSYKLPELLESIKEDPDLSRTVRELTLARRSARNPSA